MNIFEVLTQGIDTPKYNNTLNKISNTNYLVSILASTFEYRNLPEEINHRFIEFYLIKLGLCGFMKDKKSGKYVVFPCTRTGEVDEYGLGTEFVGAYPYKEAQGVIGKDGILIQNNMLAIPDTDIKYTVDVLGELQKSIKNNIKFSRLAPIPVVNNNADWQKVKDALKKIDKGELDVIMSAFNIANLDLGDGKSFDIINLTDVNASEKLANLSRMYDDTLKVFFNKHGQALQTQNKSAQQTSDEIHGMDSTSFIYPLSKLKERKDAIDKINSLYGLNIEVDFSDAWKREFDTFMEDEPIEVEPREEVEKDATNKQESARESDD